MDDKAQLRADIHALMILLSDRGNWLQHMFAGHRLPGPMSSWPARGALVEDRKPKDPDANCWCIEGAVVKVTDGPDLQGNYIYSGDLYGWPRTLALYESLHRTMWYLYPPEHNNGLGGSYYMEGDAILAMNDAQEGDIAYRQIRELIAETYNWEMMTA